jgi:hypothetical protein
VRTLENRTPREPSLSGSGRRFHDEGWRRHDVPAVQAALNRRNISFDFIKRRRGTFMRLTETAA